MREVRSNLLMMTLLAALSAAAPAQIAAALGRDIEPNRRQHARGSTPADAARIGAAEAKRARRIARNQKLEKDHG